MRRKLQEIHEHETLEAILQEAQVCRLGLSLDDRPYIVPVNFGYEDGKLYVHGADEGKKIEMLRQNPNVCFEVEMETMLAVKGSTPCSWGMHYRSVIGYGTARLVETETEKRHGLDVIVRHYGGEPPEYSAETLEKIGVIEIRVEEMTGKRSNT